MMERENNRQHRVGIWLASFILISGLAASSPLWLDLALDAIPDRYIEAYAPEAIKRIAFSSDEETVLPEVSSLDAEGVPFESLMESTETPGVIDSIELPLQQGQLVRVVGTEDEGLNLREQADVDSAWIETVPEGTEFVLGIAGGNEDGFEWWLVVDPQTNEPRGWVVADFLEAIGEEEVDIAAEAVFLQTPDVWKLAANEEVPQWWNNCGPATFTSVLAWYGVEYERTASGYLDQSDAANWLKPNAEDRQVGPDEIERYVESKGLRAKWFYGGDVEVLQRLIYAGFLPTLEIGYRPGELENTTARTNISDTVRWTSHFLPLHGYNKSTRTFDAVDSFQSTYEEISFDELEHYWRQFNYRVIVVYEPDKEEQIRDLVGSLWEESNMYQRAYNQALAERNQNQDDPYAWFNMGTNLMGMGRADEAVIAFEKAQELGIYDKDVSWRMLWYQFGPFEAYYATGQYEKLIVLSKSVLAQNEYAEEAYYWQGQALVAMGRGDEARFFFNRALSRNFGNPGFEDAQVALQALG